MSIAGEAKVFVKDSLSVHVLQIFVKHESHGRPSSSPRKLDLGLVPEFSRYLIPWDFTGEPLYGNHSDGRLAG